MGGSTKEITVANLQIERLMDRPNDISKSIMKEAFKRVNLGGKIINKTFGKGIVDLKGSFNDGFLEALGYNPSEKVLLSGIDKIDLLLWSRTRFNNQSISDVANYSIRGELYYDRIAFWLQNNKGYNIKDRKLFEDGKWWIYHSLVKNGMFITVNMVNQDNQSEFKIYEISSNPLRDYLISQNQNIRKTFHNPGISDVIYMEYHPAWYVSAVFNTSLGSSGEVIVTYKVESIRFDYGAERNCILALEEESLRIKESINKQLREEQLIYEYKIGEIWYLDIVNKTDYSTLDLFTEVSAYPMISLKSGYAFVNETNAMKAITNKLGLTTEVFKESLADSNIHSAFISFTVPFNDVSPQATKYFFEYFDRIGSTYEAGLKGATVEKKEITVSLGSLGLYSNVNLTKTYISGSIGTIGTYARESRSESVYHPSSSGYNNNGEFEIITAGYSIVNTVVFKKQRTEEYYEEIIVSSLECTTSLGGYVLKSEASLTDPDLYVPLIRDIIEPWAFKDFSYMIGLSLSIVVVSTQTYKVKWYQTGFFKAIFFMVGALMAAYTGPIGFALYVTITTLSATGVLRGTFLKVIAVIMIIYGGYAGVTSATATTTSTALSVAGALTSLANLAVSINTEHTINGLNKAIASKQAESDKLEEEYKKTTENLDNGIWVGNENLEPELLYTLSSTDAMCNYDVLYDIDSSIESIFPI